MVCTKWGNESREKNVVNSGNFYYSKSTKLRIMDGKGTSYIHSVQVSETDTE